MEKKRNKRLIPNWCDLSSEEKIERMRHIIKKLENKIDSHKELKAEMKKIRGEVYF